MPSNASVPDGVVEHKVSDFSIIAVAASRALDVPRKEIEKVVTFAQPSSASGAAINHQRSQSSAKREHLDDLSDLSDFEYAPGSDSPAFRRERYSNPPHAVFKANCIHRPLSELPDQRKRVKLSEEPTAAAPCDESSAPQTKRQRKNRDKRRTAGKYNDTKRKAETLTSTVPTLNASNFNISNTGWQGKNPRGTKSMREIVDGWKDNTILIPLTRFVRIPHDGQVFLSLRQRNMLIEPSLLTRIRDFNGRHWCTRSFASEKMRTEYLPAFATDANWLYSQVEASRTGFSAAAREANNRGSHWSSNFGHDRNYKSVGSVSFRFESF